MPERNFTCIRDGHSPYRTLIYEQGGTLKIKVINMQDEHFRPMRGEVHYYGDTFGDVLAFETIGYSGQNKEEIEAAIRWYATWIDYPQMKIFQKNPSM